jgi:O-antigen ligase
LPPLIATILFAFGIIGLFLLERDPRGRTSKALWIPVAWISFIATNSLAGWLQTPQRVTVDQYAEGNPLERLIYGTLLVAGIAVLAGRVRPVAALLCRNAPILLFVAYCGISVLWSDFPDLAFKRWVKSLGDFVVVLIILTDPDRTTAVKRFLTRTAFTLIPISVLLVKYYPDLGMAYKSNWERRVAVGITNDKNMLGAVCLLFGLGAVWRVAQVFRAKDKRRNTRSLIAQVTVLVMALWLFAKAQSMTSLACFALAAGLLVATTYSTFRKRVMVHLVVALILVTTFSVLILKVGTSLLESMGRDPTLTGRENIWNEVIELAKNPVVGTGFESFWLGSRLESMWSRYWWRPNEAHNGYIEVYLNLGWIGLIFLTAVAVNAYRNAVGMLRWDQELARLRLAYVLIGLVYSFTEAGFRFMSPVWIFFLLGAFVLPTAQVRKPSPTPDVAAEPIVVSTRFAEA